MPIPEILQGRLRLPVIGAPMFIVSTPQLVLAQCKAGIVGAFPALNARPAAQLDDWLAEITAELGELNLAGLEVKGGLHMVRLDLPAPSGVVPMRISGGASEVVVRRPAGVAARVHLQGWASELVFDEQTFSAVGNNVRLQSSGFDLAAPYYDIEVASSANQFTIISG